MTISEKTFSWSSMETSKLSNLIENLFTVKFMKINSLILESLEMDWRKQKSSAENSINKLKIWKILSKILQKENPHMGKKENRKDTTSFSNKKMLMLNTTLPFSKHWTLSKKMAVICPYSEKNWNLEECAENKYFSLFLFSKWMIEISDFL